jgi:hypothetical protein
MTTRSLLPALLLLAPWCARALDMTGQILNKAGTPVPGAIVMILAAGPRTGSSPLCPYTYPDCGKQTLTDEAGRFQIGSLDPAMDFCIIALAPGFEPGIDSSLLPEKAPVKMKLRERDLAKLAPERVISGRIIGVEGEPVAGAIVSVDGVCKGDSTHWGGNSIDSMTVSDLHGEFHIVSREDFTAAHAVVTAPGRCPRWFRLEPAKMSLLRLKAGSSVSGRLFFEGRPLAGVKLGMATEERECGKSFVDLHSETGADGRFVFGNIPAGTKLQLFARMDAMQKYGAGFRVDITSAEEGQPTALGDVTAGPSYRMSGQVVLADGKAIPPKTRLMVTRKLAWDQLLVEVGEDGRFSIAGLPREQIELHFTVPGYRTSAKNPNLDLWSKTSLTGRMESDVEGLKFLLDPGGLLAPAFADFERPSDEAMEAAAKQIFRGAP